MASLLLLPPPATAIHTTKTNASRRSSSPPSPSWSSNFLTYTDRCHRLQIFSAAGKHQNSSNYKNFKYCVPSYESDLKDCLTDEDTNTITDYNLPEFKTLKTRYSAHHASVDYISKYNKAISMMKKLPDSDPRSFMNQANIHFAYCGAFYYQGGTDDKRLQVHNSWLFFPFHRWYLYFHERILGKLIGDPNFALPYWYWDNEEGMKTPPMFNDIHERDVGVFYSAARYPIFYAHHCNVDRMWTLWQKLPSYIIPDRKIHDPDFLNATFLFYDENSNLVRVSAKDCVDNERMGYKYKTAERPGLNAKTKRLSAPKLPKATELFPLKLDGIVRFEVDKTAKGKADESLVVENIVVNDSKFVKFEVFVNKEEGVDNVETNNNTASYAGMFPQVPHVDGGTVAPSSIKLRLTDLYNNMDVEGDESIVVTLVPHHERPDVTPVARLEGPKDVTSMLHGHGNGHGGPVGPSSKKRKRTEDVDGDVTIGGVKIIAN